MVELPSGTVTFLFTDIEGSTRLWEEHPDAMRDALARHDELLRDAIAGHGGHVVKTTGDGCMAAFATAEAGVVAAVAAQRALDGEAWALPELLRVRMGLHTGGASLRDGDYFGPSLNRAARLMGVAHGGQVVCSQATTDLARDVLAEGVEFVDLGEHRLRDLTRAERVFQVNAEGLGSEFAALSSVDAFPGNLPLQVSSFIGREWEIDQAVAALSEARVVTLTGVGGVGKTRLALQVAAEVLPRFREGAWLIELAPVRDPDAVVDAFAAVFGVTARMSQTLVEALAEFLRTKQLLLVVDNCEHVLDPVADLVDEIARSCPGINVFATSREGLAIVGERILAVPSLASPPAVADLDVVAASDAVQLFLDRAQSADGNFVLAPDNAASVARVCRRLDGVPLAIELAAARISMMSPTELASALDHRFEVLAGGRRGAVKRQQTLRATIDWSYDLLEDAQQRLLDRMAVFAGGCTLDAIQTVCAGAPIEARTAFGLLGELVSRSLVVAERGGLDTRYRLLETIREYGEERLIGHGETEALRDRHAEYYCQFEHVVGEKAYGPGQIEACERLAAEHENLLAAMNYAIDTDRIDLALQLLSYQPGAEQFGYELRLPVDVIDLRGAGEHPLYPRALVEAAWLAANRGDRQIAESLCTDALAAAQRIGADFHSVEAFVWAVRSTLNYAVGALADAAVDAERVLEASRSAGLDSRRSTWLGAAAIYRAMAGDADVAIVHAEEGLALARQVGQPFAIGLNLASLAAALAERDPPRARELLRESVELSATMRHENTSELSQAVLVAARLGDWPLALDLATRSIRGLHWVGNQTLCAAIFNVVAGAIAASDPEGAARLQGSARALASIVPRSDSAARSPGEPGSLGSKSAGQPSSAGGFVAQLRRQTAGTLRDTLGEERLRELRAEGAAMDFDRAVAYAVDTIVDARDHAPD